MRFEKKLLKQRHLSSNTTKLFIHWGYMYLGNCRTIEQSQINTRKGSLYVVGRKYSSSIGSKDTCTAAQGGLRMKDDA